MTARPYYLSGSRGALSLRGEKSRLEGKVNDLLRLEVFFVEGRVEVLHLDDARVGANFRL